MRSKSTAIAAMLTALSLTQVTGCASTPQDRSTGRVFDDGVITAKVKTALIQEPGIVAGDINVTTYRGVVQLSGFVDSEDVVRRAGSIARNTEGVRSVDNDLRIAPARR
jgi:hyperosmotically inducible periplasmic protein